MLLFYLKIKFFFISECKYAKNTDWSPCENGKKSKTLTLIGKDSSPACEPTKEVIKECRKKSKSRPKNKKNNSNVPTDNSEQFTNINQLLIKIDQN